MQHGEQEKFEVCMHLQAICHIDVAERLIELVLQWMGTV